MKKQIFILGIIMMMSITTVSATEWQLDSNNAETSGGFDIGTMTVVGLFDVMSGFIFYDSVVSGAVVTFYDFDQDTCSEYTNGGEEGFDPTLYSSFCVYDFNIEESYYFQIVSVEGGVLTLNNETPCTPSWVCSGYASCVSPDLTSACNSVVDANVCNESYTGDYSEFEDQACDYSFNPGLPPGSVSGGSGSYSSSSDSRETEVLFEDSREELSDEQQVNLKKVLGFGAIAWAAYMILNSGALGGSSARSRKVGRRR